MNTSTTAKVSIEYRTPCPDTNGHVLAFAERVNNGMIPVTTTREIEININDGFANVDGYRIADAMFHQTNMYQGDFWDALQPLPENRSHTAISMGDVVIIDGVRYACAELGWEIVGDGETIEMPGYLV